jgi:hypothetical protein
MTHTIFGCVAREDALTAIATEDVADAAATILLDYPSHEGRTYNLAATPFTHTQVGVSCDVWRCHTQVRGAGVFASVGEFPFVLRNGRTTSL